MNTMFLSLTLMIAFFINISKATPLPTQLRAPNILTSENTTVAVGEKKAMVVVFLSASCPCSNSHVHELSSLVKEYPDFVFVGVHANTDEGKAQTVEYFKKVALPFPVLQDSGAKMADQFKALKTPHAFVVSPRGEILYQGGVSSSHNFESADRKYLREALEDLKKNQHVKTPEGRTLGCTISRGGANVW